VNKVKEAELDRLNKKMTHYNRYLIVSEKMAEFGKELEQRAYIEENDHIKMNDLSMEFGESLIDMLNDLIEENEHLKHQNHITSNALRHYAETCGNHLVSNKFPDNEQFMVTVTILPEDDQSLNIDVKVHVIEEKE
jgi:hypothetical protein